MKSGMLFLLPKIIVVPHVEGTIRALRQIGTWIMTTRPGRCAGFYVIRVIYY